MRLCGGRGSMIVVDEYIYITFIVHVIKKEEKNEDKKEEEA